MKARRHAASACMTAALALDHVVYAQNHLRGLARGFYGLRLDFERLYHSMGFHVHGPAVDHIDAKVNAAFVVLVSQLYKYVYRVFPRGFRKRA